MRSEQRVGKVLVYIGENALAHGQIGRKCFDSTAFRAADAGTKQCEHCVLRGLRLDPVEISAQRLQTAEIIEKQTRHGCVGQHDEAMQVAPACDLFQLVARYHHGDARAAGCLAFNGLRQVDDDDVALLRLDIDPVEVSVQVAAGDKLQDILIEPALGDELWGT